MLCFSAVAAAGCYSKQVVSSPTDATSAELQQALNAESADKSTPSTNFYKKK
jgi:hypothetical protein